MKNFILLIFSLIFVSCGDIFLSEEVLAESTLNKLTNYDLSIVGASPDEAYVSVTKSIFDKSQLTANCVSPLRTESEILLLKNQEIVKVNSPFVYTYGLKRDGDIYQRVSENYEGNNRQLVIEKYTLNYELKSKNTYSFVKQIKAQYEYIQPGPTLNGPDNENYITYSTSNYTKPTNAKIFLAKTNGSGLSPLYEFEFKNRQNCSILGLTFGADGNPYLLVNVNSKTEGAYNILKLDLKKNTLELENEFVLDQIGVSKFKKFKDDSFIIYHGQNYLQNPSVYIYSLSSQSISTKPINFSKIGQNFAYAGPQVNYEGEKFLLNYIRDNQGAVTAELTDDLEIIPVFENKEVNSSNKVVDTPSGGLIMYELSNPWRGETKDLNIYRHTSLSDISKKTIYNDNANVNQCRLYD